MITSKSNFGTMNDEKFILITRIFDAPIDLVFEAWTDPQQLKRWYAPDGCTIQFTKIDICPGGSFHSCIQNPTFGDCWGVGTYYEVVKNERIVFTMAIADRKGNLVSPVDVGMDPEWPRETIVTVTFSEELGKTKVTLHQTANESLAKRTGAYPSWIQMLDKLADDLSSRV